MQPARHPFKAGCLTQKFKLVIFYFFLKMDDDLKKKIEELGSCFIVFKARIKKDNYHHDDFREELSKKTLRKVDSFAGVEKAELIEKLQVALLIAKKRRLFGGFSATCKYCRVTIDLTCMIFFLFSPLI